MEFQTKNPVLNNIESKMESSNYSYVTGKTASFTGIGIKSSFLLGIIVAISAMIWAGLIPVSMGLLIGAVFVGFLSVIFAGVSQRMTVFFTVLYAVSEGVVLGTLTAIVNDVYPGIVGNAVIITFVIFAFLLFAYSTGIFKVGDKFRKIVFTAMISAIIFFFVSMILSALGATMFEMSPGMLIIITLAMVLLASFNLLIDFDNCKLAVEQGVPSRYEWYLSLGLLVSLVWLYIEVLRLLIIISRYFKD